MMTSTNINRRVFLRALLWLAALGLPGPARAVTHSQVSRDTHLLAVRLTGLFSHKKSARIIGVEYFRIVPNEAEVGLLVDLICSNRSERRVELAGAETEQLREIVKLQQRDDFTRGRIVKVQGWMLSETEARLCALSTLV